MNLHLRILCLLLTMGIGPRLFGQSTTFTYTGAPQVYVVPQGCVTEVEIDARGAEGGGNSVALGGMGGRVVARIPATAGETLYVYVGGTGTVDGTPGYNGGGSGVGGSAGNPGSGGGGASDVRKGGSTLADRWVVAGGGGGGMENGGPAMGGAGGDLIGGSGNAGTNPWGCTNLVLPTGGTQSSGGMGGTSVSCAWNGNNGSFGVGGNSYYQYRSAGGGGGWYGGGGAHNGTSGGGGSSYTHPSATNVAHFQGVHLGNGTITLTPISGFSVDLGPDTTVCNPLTLDPGQGVSWTWNTGATTQSITPTASGLYYVEVTDINGCIAVDSINVTLAPVPTVNLGADTTICDSILLDAGPGGTYLWSTGATTQTIIVPAGSYSVTYTNGAGCSGSDDIVLTQAAEPTIPLGPTASGCDSVTLDAGNPGATYLWSTGATTQTISVSTSGNYSVTVTETTGCMFSDSDTVTVTVGTAPTVSIVNLFPFYCFEDSAFMLQGNPPGGTFAGPSVSGNIFDPSLTIFGPQTVTYTYTDSLGCIGTTSMITEVVICDAVIPASEAGISIFPNPNAGRFDVGGLSAGAQVSIWNLVGQQVWQGDAGADMVRIDLGAKAPGYYMVRIYMDGKHYAGRVLLQ